ncbi:MAG: hypothetical protein BM564_05640 [Bacteroidetes bacterium MedPE-SWsnd-G2]|nr:MAG: hypothetical protein BM564_05640 [Bacteroidetes bacterium MedPE-SWsnd-G2]
MKSIYFILIAALIFYNCNNNKTEAKPEAQEPTKEEVISIPSTLEGTWELVNFYNYDNNTVTDSFNAESGYRQVKMYSKHKVMWTKHVPSDSAEWFGYGTYKHEDGMLIESLEYGSQMMDEVIKSRESFIYELDLEENKFSQIEVDEDGNRIYAENYIRIEK